MTGYFYLAIAITAEVIATTSMKSLAGFSRPLPLFLVIAGYSLSFWWSGPYRWALPTPSGQASASSW
ncbi:hypothetical protein PSEUDO9AG_10299 [Pseudomonas sp. 9Ag]|nr:hypothetical protein PSEUDO9AG_10299 [Pseudomonas sp. 9Ag]